MSGRKTCTKCEREKPATLEFFYRLRGGLRAACKECEREPMSARKKALRLAHPERGRAYRERTREQRAERDRRWREANAERISRRKHAYYLKHRAEVIAKARRYQLGHMDQVLASCSKRRARKRGSSGHHTGQDTIAQLARQKGRCYWCGEKVGSGYHTDHVIPLSLGGSDGPENIVIACPFCNISKGAKHPMDYAGVMC